MKKQLKHDGATFSFEVFQAEVLDSNQRSDTIVQGSGGGVIHKGSGYVNTNVTSHVEVKTNLWVNLEGQGEMHLKFNFDAAFRSGQKLKLIYLQIESPEYCESNRLYAVLNQNTNIYNIINPLDVSNLYPFKWSGFFKWVYFVLFTIVSAGSIIFLIDFLEKRNILDHNQIRNLMILLSVIPLYSIWRVIKPFFMMFYDPMKDEKSREYIMKKRFEEEFQSIL